MKTLITVTCACLFFVACAGSVTASTNGTDELLINIQLMTGENSKDSTTRTTTITVARDAIVWEQEISGGRRGGRTPPLRKEFELPSADKRMLLKLIRANNLLVTESTEHSRGDGSNLGYFEMSVALTLDGKKGAINISGPRKTLPVKEEKLYQNTMTLVRELYRIMNSQGGHVYFEELL